MVYKFFDKKTSGRAATLAPSETFWSEVLATRATRNKSAIKNQNMSNKELAAESFKPVIWKFKKLKVHSTFVDNIWGADLADVMSKFNIEIPILLCVTDIYSEYTWVIPLKDGKEITNTNAFQKILDESKLKPNKIWVDKGREFNNRSMKSWLEKNDVEIY